MVWNRQAERLNDFLRPLVNDINGIIAHGAIINDHRLDIQIRCFICDSPARSFLKGIYNLSMNISCAKSNLNTLRHLNQWNITQKKLFSEIKSLFELSIVQLSVQSTKLTFP